MFALKARGLDEKPFARNWMALISVSMGVSVLFIGDVAAVITNRPSQDARQLSAPAPTGKTG